MTEHTLPDGSPSFTVYEALTGWCREEEALGVPPKVIVGALIMMLGEYIVAADDYEEKLANVIDVLRAEAVPSLRAIVEARRAKRS